MQSIVSGPPDIPTTLPEECQSFLQCCLVNDQHKRASIDRLKQHPFIAHFTHDSSIQIVHDWLGTTSASDAKQKTSLSVSDTSAYGTLAVLSDIGLLSTTPSSASVLTPTPRQSFASPQPSPSDAGNEALSEADTQVAQDTDIGDQQSDTTVVTEATTATTSNG
jgi:serine/threonine protein kinase